MNLQEQSIFYNEYWNQYKPFGSYKIKRIAQIIGLLHDARKQKKNLKILDLGCGDGRCCAIWNEIGITTGLDLSTTAMERASVRYPYLSFSSGDGTKTNFEDASFDTIISQEVLEHIEVQSNYINECARLLTESGLLILTTPNKYFFDRKKGGNYSRQPVENIINAKELELLLAEKFKIIKLYSIIHPGAEYGVYGFLAKLGISKLLEGMGLLKTLDFILGYFNLGLNLIVFAQKK